MQLKHISVVDTELPASSSMCFILCTGLPLK